ncbi:MAG TPA: hypothetical protein VEB43_10305 [Anaeromyxobacter sp.]|nr:hypothetical protein [Anaeromyxobacter sp.]
MKPVDPAVLAAAVRAHWSSRLVEARARDRALAGAKGADGAVNEEEAAGYTLLEICERGVHLVPHGTVCQPCRRARLAEDPGPPGSSDDP